MDFLGELSTMKIYNFEKWFYPSRNYIEHTDCVYKIKLSIIFECTIELMPDIEEWFIIKN